MAVQYSMTRKIYTYLVVAVGKFRTALYFDTANCLVCTRQRKSDEILIWSTGETILTG